MRVESQIGSKKSFQGIWYVMVKDIENGKCTGCALDKKNCYGMDCWNGIWKEIKGELKGE